jgi:hypothetical protein
MQNLFLTLFSSGCLGILHLLKIYELRSLSFIALLLAKALVFAILDSNEEDDSEGMPAP